MKKKCGLLLSFIASFTTYSFAQMEPKKEKEKVNPNWQEMSAKADVYIMRKSRKIFDAEAIREKEKEDKKKL